MKIFHNRNQFIIGSYTMYAMDGIETHPFKTYGIVSHTHTQMRHTNNARSEGERETMLAKENEITFVRLTKHTHLAFSNICSFDYKFLFVVRIVLLSFIKPILTYSFLYSTLLYGTVPHFQNTIQTLNSLWRQVGRHREKYFGNRIKLRAIEPGQRRATGRERERQSGKLQQ